MEPLSFFSGFALIGLIALLGAMSPGPDFVIVSKNSLLYSRKAGLYTAIGVALGVLFHVAVCLLGLGFFIAESPLLFNFIKYGGASYLIFIGLKSLFKKKSLKSSLTYLQDEKGDLSAKAALKSGFLTNVLNPKAILFFLSVFSQVISPGTHLAAQIIYALEILMITWIWFSLLAFLLSHEKLRAKLAKAENVIDRSMGALLLGFGLKIAFI